MTQVYDTLDSHIARAGDMARAYAPMGQLVAWAVNLRLVDEAAMLDHEGLLLRIRFREARGSELLVACGGDLTSDLFNADGQSFLHDYYHAYMDDYTKALGEGEDPYRAKEDWANYDKVAAVLTRRYMGGPPRRANPLSGALNKISNGLRRLWN